MNVLGLDLSLTATGVALPDGRSATWSTTRRGMERLDHLRGKVIDLLEAEPVHVVAIEGYSFNSKGNSIVNLGELGGVIRWTLWRFGFTYTDVPPPCLKKYATGAGNASKEAVLAAAIRRLGYEGHDHNQADALWLRAMALDHYGHPVVTVPAAHRDALAKVAWPELEGRAA